MGQFSGEGPGSWSSVPGLSPSASPRDDGREHRHHTVRAAPHCRAGRGLGRRPATAPAQGLDGKPVGDDFVAPLDSCLPAMTDLLTHRRRAPAVGVRPHSLAASLSQTVAGRRFDPGRHTRASR